jgi:prepilin-type N-terminal cleavage/methylation domain-containing protein
VCRKQRKRSQLGFTLVEIVVALAVAALVLVGAAALMYYMVVGTGEQSDQVTARLQVQYVSFWIGEDVVQAQSISLGNYTTDAGYKVVGFPFVLGCVDKDDVNYTVTYGVQDMKDNLGRDLMSLYRYSTENSNSGNITVAQYLDPQGTECQFQQVGSHQVGNETYDTYKLVLEVTAMVNQRESSGTYEINPRAGNVTVGG